jgi:ribulose 1,5-bisphosphate synthetase/thiazole synthase
MNGDCKPDHGIKGKDISYWIASTPDTNNPPLKDNVTVDVAILGGGIAGITTALMLKKAGLKVAVV